MSSALFPLPQASLFIEHDTHSLWSIVSRIVHATTGRVAVVSDAVRPTHLAASCPHLEIIPSLGNLLRSSDDPSLPCVATVVTPSASLVILEGFSSLVVAHGMRPTLRWLRRILEAAGCPCIVVATEEMHTAPEWALDRVVVSGIGCVVRRSARPCTMSVWRRDSGSTVYEHWADDVMEVVCERVPPEEALSRIGREEGPGSDDDHDHDGEGAGMDQSGEEEQVRTLQFDDDGDLMGGLEEDTGAFKLGAARTVRGGVRPYSPPLLPHERVVGLTSFNVGTRVVDDDLDDDLDV